jgi:hypothetical protein
MVPGRTFHENNWMDELNDDNMDHDEEDDDEEESVMELLEYLPMNPYSLPPFTLELIRNATVNHVQGKAVHPVHMWEVIASEYRSMDRPIRIDDRLLDVRATGEQMDESVAEVMSLAALCRLPKEITLQLLGSTTETSVPMRNGYDGNDDLGARTSLETCRDLFSSRGWSVVSFPQGLALRPNNRKYRRALAALSSSSLPSSSGSSWLWFRSSQRRQIELAAAAVAEAQATVAPRRRISREELLATIQLLSDTESRRTSPSSSSSFGGATSTDELLYFPDSLPDVPLSWKWVKRLIDKQSAKLKSRGRVGLLAYCFFNFVFYTVGVLWQWPRVAPAHPLSLSTVSMVVFRKFCRVFGSLYISSQLFKLPKVVAAGALLPLSSKCLALTRKRLRLSETMSTVVLVAGMVLLWSGIIAIPILAEYSRLCRFAQMERLLGIQEVVPAFYVTTRLALREC